MVEIVGNRSEYMLWLYSLVLLLDQSFFFFSLRVDQSICCVVCHLPKYVLPLFHIIGRLTFFLNQSYLDLTKFIDKISDNYATKLVSFELNIEYVCFVLEMLLSQI